MSMTISLSGVLARAAERLQKTRDAKDYAFMLLELNKHLEMLRDDPKLHEQFFNLYVKH